MQYLLGQHGKLFCELSDALEADHDERHVRHNQPGVRRRTDLVDQLRQQRVGAWGGGGGGDISQPTSTFGVGVVVGSLE